MREPSVASPSPVFRPAGWHLAPRLRIREHGLHFRIPRSHQVVLQTLYRCSGAIFFHDSGDSRDLRISGVPHDFTGAEPFRFRSEKFSGSSRDSAYTVAGEGSREGWFFPGLKSAPAVVLCPAYQSSRGELLTLASTLQDHQYNVFLIDFSAQGSNGGHTTLGFREVSELRAAIDAVANRGDVDPNRFGLWCVNLGAYAALSEATGDRRVRAVAVESPYDRPEEMVGLLVNRSGLGSLPLVAPMARWGFGWVHYKYRKVPPLRVNLGKLTGVAQLYLESPDDPVLAGYTGNLFRASPPPHELAVLPHGNYGGMLDEEKHNYENRIVSFFLVNLPPAGEPSPLAQ